MSHSSTNSKGKKNRLCKYEQKWTKESSTVLMSSLLFTLQVCYRDHSGYSCQLIQLSNNSPLSSGSCHHISFKAWHTINHRRVRTATSLGERTVLGASNCSSHSFEIAYFSLPFTCTTVRSRLQVRLQDSSLFMPLRQMTSGYLLKVQPAQSSLTLTATLQPVQQCGAPHDGPLPSFFSVAPLCFFEAD